MMMPIAGIMNNLANTTEKMYRIGRRLLILILPSADPKFINPSGTANDPKKARVSSKNRNGSVPGSREFVVTNSPRIGDMRAKRNPIITFKLNTR
jgi:hypothetical protein